MKLAKRAREHGAFKKKVDTKIDSYRTASQYKAHVLQISSSFFGGAADMTNTWLNKKFKKTSKRKARNAMQFDFQKIDLGPKVFQWISL